MERIKIDEAEAKDLRHFAEVVMGLEIKDGTNANQIRAKLKQAGYTADTIPAPAAPPEPVVQYVEVPVSAPPAPQASENLAEDEVPVRPAAITGPASAALMHPSRDPKVLIMIPKTDDKRRAKDVTVGVNGDIFRMQRGVEVSVPYRVYLALRDAKEKAPVDHPTEINPMTGEPIKVWEEVHSYPFSTLSMPSREEIARWEAETGSGFKNVA